MTEIMSWKDDEKLYQPRIHSKRIRELHKIAEQMGQPMTTVLDLALRKFVDEAKTNPLPEVSPSQNDNLNLKTREGSGQN